MTLRDRMGREVGEGFRMGNICTPMKQRHVLSTSIPHIHMYIYVCMYKTWKKCMKPISNEKKLQGMPVTGPNSDVL